MRRSRCARVAWVALCALLGVACSRPGAGSATSADSASGAEQPPPALPPPPVPEVVHDEPVREYVPREVVQEVLEAGMGRLLGRVQVDPARDDAGQFVGYRVVALDPIWQGGPVQVGDVVVRLNGMTLQTPDAAQRALDTLTVASEIVLELIRDGEPTRTHLAIH